MKMDSTATPATSRPVYGAGRRHGRAVQALALGGLLDLASLARPRAEDRVDYRYEDYAEEGEEEAFDDDEADSEKESMEDGDS